MTSIWIDKILGDVLMHDHISADISDLTATLDPRYLVKAGITGGQTAIGGTGITDILKLQSTTGNGTLTSPAIQLLTGNNGATTAVTVLNNGNVGIGTTAPSSKLHVYGVNAGSDNTLWVENDSAGSGTTADLRLGRVGVDYLHLSANTNNGNAYVGTGGNFPLNFTINDATRMTLNVSGYLGIGTTNPSRMLTVAGNLFVDSGMGTFTYNSAPRIEVTSAGGATETVLTLATYNTNSNTHPALSFSQSRQGTEYEPARISVSGVNNGSTGSLSFWTNNGSGVAEQVRITNTGNVGIGTDAPAGRLHINGTANDQQLIVEAHSTQTSNLVELHNSSSAVLASFDGVGGAVINEQGNATADFRVEGDTDDNLLFVDASADKVGIGKNNPAYKLDVTGEINATTGYRVNGTAGATGTFTTADAKTVTVTNGIITAIV